MSTKPKSLSEVRALAEQSLGDPDAAQHFQQALGVTPEAFAALDEQAQTKHLHQRSEPQKSFTAQLLPQSGQELLRSDGTLKGVTLGRAQGKRGACIQIGLPKLGIHKSLALEARDFHEIYAHVVAIVAEAKNVPLNSPAYRSMLDTKSAFIKVNGVELQAVTYTQASTADIKRERSGREEFAKAYGIEQSNALDAAAPSGTVKLLSDAAFAIKALREYIQAIPEEVVASLPAMPGIDGDWLGVVEADLEDRTKALKAAEAESTGQAHSPSLTIKVEQVFADVPGEQGAAWRRVCDEENRLASYLAQHGEGIAVVRDDDAWYLKQTEGQQLVLMHGEVQDGCVENGVSRFQMGLDWVDLEVNDLYTYSTLVGGVADALQAGNGLWALKKDGQELFLQPLDKNEHVMKADDSHSPGM